MIVAEAMKVPYPAKVNGEDTLLFSTPEDRTEYMRDNPEALYQSLGLVAIAYFHDPAYRDYEYIAASHLDKDEDDVWTRDFGLTEQMVWMAGFGRSRQELDILHLVERNNGSFRSRYGWNPAVIIDEAPTEGETESYIAHEAADLWTAPGMPIEFFEGDEDV